MRAWIVFLLSFAILDFFLLVQLGAQIGAFWAIVLCALGALCGLKIIGRQLTNVFFQVRVANAGGELHAQNAANKLLVMVGGVLMILPGPISDLLGLGVMIPPLRMVLSDFLCRIVKNDLSVFVRCYGTPNVVDAEARPSGQENSSSSEMGMRVVEGEKLN